MSNTIKKWYSSIDIKAMSSASNKIGIYEPDEIYKLGASGGHVEGKKDVHDYVGFDTKEGGIVFTCNNDHSYADCCGVCFYPNDKEKQGLFIDHKLIKNIKRIFSDTELVNDNNYKTTVARINDALSRVKDLSQTEQVGAYYE